MSGENTGPSKFLVPLQRDFLNSFFDLTQDFFLTGGAALVGFYGLERVTRDLDLFTLRADAFQAVDLVIREVAKQIGAEAESIQTFTTFRRYLLRRGDEGIELDFVHELAPQVCETKSRLGKSIVDPIEEIVANKVCTVVSRTEVRDLWDLYHLVEMGCSFQAALEGASRKDGGVGPESLVYVLASLNWSAMAAAAELSGLKDWSQVESFFVELSEQLALGLLP